MYIQPKILSSLIRWNYIKANWKFWTFITMHGLLNSPCTMSHFCNIKFCHLTLEYLIFILHLRMSVQSVFLCVCFKKRWKFDKNLQKRLLWISLKLDENLMRVCNKIVSSLLYVCSMAFQSSLPLFSTLLNMLFWTKSVELNFKSSLDLPFLFCFFDFLFTLSPDNIWDFSVQIES